MKTTDVIVTLESGEQVHVQIRSGGSVEVEHVATRPREGLTWGPPARDMVKGPFCARPYFEVRA